MRTSAVLAVASLLSGGLGLAAGGVTSHPDLSLPAAGTEAPTELEPLEVIGRRNPLDTSIDRARLLVDMTCKLCKDADFSVKGVPLDRFQDLMLSPATKQTVDMSIALQSRCGDNPAVYASCFVPGLAPFGNFKEERVTNAMFVEFVRLLRGQ